MKKIALTLVGILTMAAISLAQTEGKPAPDFSMVNLEGKTIKLSEFKGQPVVVNFWATWCPVCNAEMPKVNAALAQMKNKVVFLAISRDESQDRSVVADHIKAKGWSFTHVLANPPKDASTAERIGEVTKRYNIIGQPWFFFIDAEGVVKKVHRGGLADGQLQTYLAEIGVKAN